MSTGHSTFAVAINVFLWQLQVNGIFHFPRLYSMDVKGIILRQRAEMSQMSKERPLYANMETAQRIAVTSKMTSH